MQPVLLDAALGCGRTVASSDANKPVFPGLGQPGEITGSCRLRAQFCGAIRSYAQQALRGICAVVRSFAEKRRIIGAPG
jgi:hypothetical protein